MSSITFLGASGTVTGSKYLVQSNNKKILIDCGLFQGSREWREHNWDRPDVDLKTIDAVILTHAHIDHIGLLPRYFKYGLKCPIYATAPTIELAKILLLDSGRLQEEEASYRSKHKASRHNPVLPLYTEKDAEDVLPFLKEISPNKLIQIFSGVSAEWVRSGHIIGACSVQLMINDKKITFSGDIGRYGAPILFDPTPVEFGDLLLIESTYGDRLHPKEDEEESLKKIINETSKRNGSVIIPSFAVGRTQNILYYIRELKEKNEIPDLPVIVDSPMALDATEIYAKFPADYDEDTLGIIKKGRKPFSFSKLHFTRTVEESKQINRFDSPMIIISASGMLTGGRILHHLRHRISDPRNTILFVGFQPPGSRGAWIKSGAETVRLMGEDFPIRAEIKVISGCSAHGDYEELLRWCREGKGIPKLVKVVHGEPESAETFANKLRENFNWNVEVAKYQEEMTI